MNSYTTVSRTKILEFLKLKSDRTVNVKDISDYLSEQNCDVNVTTIYRYLDRLCKDGSVIRYVSESGTQAVYQFVESAHHCEDHLHLKCTNCGCIVHLDCGFMDELSEHIEKEHGFKLQCKNSIIYGLCEECGKV